MMKKVFILFLLIIISASALFGAAQTAVVKSAIGKVTYKVPGADWSAVSSGMQIPIGATISTGFNSKAVLELGASTLEVKALTRMRLDELAEQGGVVSTDLFLQVGRVKADVKAVEGLQSNFTLKSPVTTASVRGTSFSFDGINIRVQNGRVVVSNRNNHSATYKGGESGSSTGNNPPAGGAAGREGEIIVRADTSDILGGSDDPFVDTGSTQTVSGVQYGSIKVQWTYVGPN